MKRQQEYDNWIENINKQEYAYIVPVTKRTGSLIEILLENKTDLNWLDEHLITTSGLLLEVDAIAKYYRKYNRFPTIAFVVDVLVHGRYLESFLDKFIDLLFNCIDIHTDDRYKELLRSITIWAFAVNNEPLCMKQDYKWKVRYQTILNERDLRELGASIVELTESNRKTGVDSCDNSISYEHWIVRSGKEYKAYALDMDSIGNNIYPIIYSQTKDGTAYYEPHLFIGRLKSSQILGILNEVMQEVKEFDKDLSSKLIKAFNSIGKYKERIVVYHELFNSVLNSILLSVFIQDMNKHTQIQRSIMEFNSEIDRLLDKVAHLDWKKEQFIKILQVGLSATDSTTEGADRCADTIDLCGDSNFDIDLEVYKQALRYNKSLFETDRSTYNSRESLYELIAREKSDKIDTLCKVIHMCHDGYINLVEEVYRDASDSYVFDISIKTTELTLSIYPKKIGSIYADFLHVTRLYLFNNDYVSHIERYFDSCDEPVRSDIMIFAKLISEENRTMIDTMLNWSL